MIDKIIKFIFCYLIFLFVAINFSKGEINPSNKKNLPTNLQTRKDAYTATFSIPAPRGQILDKNGRPLAQNKLAYYCSIKFPIFKKKFPKEKILLFAKNKFKEINLLLSSSWELSDNIILDHYKNRKWIPLKFSDPLNKEQIKLIKLKKPKGIALETTYVRHYPENETLAHVIGYMGRRPPIQTTPIVNKEPLWREAEAIYGLEKIYDDWLKGTPGEIYMFFDSNGKKIKELIIKRPIPGHNLVTSIDLDAQKVCEGLLNKGVNNGSMIIMDVENGDILAMASNPSFNLNDFIPYIPESKFKELTNHTDKPMFPRAFQATYPAASVFKVVSALSFLESGYITINDMIPCPEKFTIANKLSISNWNSKNEGSMNVIGAIIRSCNTWFYKIGINVGANPMSNMATRLGLGYKTGISLNDDPGFIPNNSWSEKVNGHKLSDGEEAMMSIGQGFILTTPLQVVKMMAGIANKRSVLAPRIAVQVQDINNEIREFFPTKKINDINLDIYHMDIIHKALYDVVNSPRGTGKRAKHYITVSGKTGTGQWKLNRKQNVAWFSGFFPSKNPVYAFTILCEGKPHEKINGGKKAAPIIKSFLNKYLTDKIYKEIYERSEEIGLKNKKLQESENFYAFTMHDPIEAIYSNPVTENKVTQVRNTNKSTNKNTKRNIRNARDFFKFIINPFKRN